MRQIPMTTCVRLKALLKKHYSNTQFNNALHISFYPSLPCIHICTQVHYKLTLVWVLFLSAVRDLFSHSRLSVQTHILFLQPALCDHLYQHLHT